MVFSSPVFLFAFLPAVFLLERLCPSLRAKNIFLAAASLVFYAFGQLVFLPLFLGSVLLNYLAGLGLCRRLRFRSGKGARGHSASHRHLLLHLPGHELCDRRVPGP